MASSTWDTFCMIALILVFIGAINSGMNAAFEIDPIGTMFGCDIESWIYILIGISALFLIVYTTSANLNGSNKSIACIRTRTLIFEKPMHE